MDELEQGIAALKAGKQDEARKLLAIFLKQNPNNERAWLWMFNAAKNDQEKKYCLEQAIRINPKNEKAVQLLKQMDGLFTPETAKIPVIQQQAKPVQQQNTLIGIVTVLCICMACFSFIFGMPGKKEEKDYKTAAFIQCQLYVENRLKSPSTADFPASSSVNIQELENKVFVIKSYVDAQNSFGAMIRTYFYCQIQYIGSEQGDEYDTKNWNLLQLNFLE